MNKTMTVQLSVLLIFTFLGTSALAQTKPACRLEGRCWKQPNAREWSKCACPPRREFALAFKKGFEDAYPGIPLEITRGDLAGVSLRVAKEQGRQNVSVGCLYRSDQERRYSI